MKGMEDVENKKVEDIYSPTDVEMWQKKMSEYNVTNTKYLSTKFGVPHIRK